MRVTIFFLFILVFIPVFLAAQDQPSFNPAEPFHKYSRQMDAYYEQVGKKAPGYKQWKRLQWYQETRLDANGKVPAMANLKQQAIEQISMRTQQLRTTQNDLFMASWNFLGPTAVTSSDDGIGRVNRITFHPTIANTFFVAAAGGGLWKTTNAGSNWTCLTDGLPNINTSGMALNYNNTNIMYLLTGDADASSSGAMGCCQFGQYSSGVLKTYDGGNTWSTTGLINTISNPWVGYNIKMHPTNPDILFVTSSSGIYRTVNGGATWSVVLNAFTYDLEFKPGNPSVVYASGRQDIFRSTDGGVNWASVYTLPGSMNGRTELAVTALDANYLYAVCGPAGNNSFRGLVRSTDGGDNFTVRTNIPNILGRDQFGLDADDQSSYDLTITVAPANKENIVVGGIYLWQSVNGGNTFSRIPPSSSYHADIHDIKYHPLAPHLLYHCSDGGVYLLNTLTAMWSDLNTGLQVTQYYKISTAQTNNHQLTGGTQDNGTHKMNLISPVYNRILGGDGMDNGISPSNSNFIYGSLQNGVFFKSINNGSSFFNILDDNDHDNENLSPAWVTPLALHPTDNNTVFIGTAPVIKLYEEAGVRLITKLALSGRSVLTVAPSNADKIYAASRITVSENSVIYKTWRSDNGGVSATEILSTYSSTPITGLAVNPDNANEIFACFGGFDADNKVLKSNDGGANWTDYTGSLPNVPVNCIVYYDTNGSPDDAIYIGTDIGVFYRDNSLGDWIPYNMGLPVVEVTDLEIQYSSGVLRAGTYGRGIWQTPLFSTTCTPSYVFSANSHNPSTPYFYQAGTSITSTAQLSGAGANVQYRAGGRVILQPGFYASTLTDAKFSATVGSCLSGGVPPGYLLPTYNGLKGNLVQ